MLKINNLVKSYQKGVKAVNGLTLSVNKGEIYGFIGHNGAGKSTTIKAIVGALDFNEGEILIDGVNVKIDPLTCKRNIAFVPDNPDVYEYLTGIQYLNFIANLFDVDKKERKARIEKYATLFGLEKNLSQVISSYSHGMKQKLVIISALIHQPKLLVLDEPFVGLDPMATHNLKNIMREFCSEGGAIFFSTHVLEVAEKLCDRVGIIKKGKLIKEGAVSEMAKDKSLEDLFLETADE